MRLYVVPYCGNSLKEGGIDPSDGRQQYPPLYCSHIGTGRLHFAIECPYL